MSKARHWLRVTAPFILLAIGFWRLWRSPWPAIWRLSLKGQHVWVKVGWETYGQLALVVVCFVAALVIAFTIRRADRPIP